MTFAMPHVSSTPLAVLALFGTLACGGGGEAPGPGDPGQPAPDPGQPGSPGSPSVSVLNSTAAPGSTVTVQASGFNANTGVQIGVGPPESEYTVVRETRTDAQGRLETSLQVPDWAERGETLVVVVTEPDHDPRATSDPFIVGSGGDRIQVRGTLTDEGVECPALRSRAGALYTLAVSGLEYGPGTEVMVEGTIADMSTCMQGTTIQVESIEQR